MKRIYIILMAALGSAATPLPFVIHNCSADETEPAQLSLAEEEQKRDKQKKIIKEDLEKRNRELDKIR